MASERSQSTPMSKVSTDSVTTNYKPDLRSGREGSESLRQKPYDEISQKG